MIHYAQLATHKSEQCDKSRKQSLEKLFKFWLLFLALALSSCNKSGPIEPEERNDVGIWNAVDMGQISTGTVGGQLLIADLRHDGIPRVYLLAGGILNDLGINEFTHDSSGWTKTRIDAGGSGYGSIAIGKCKRDGIVRLYASSASKISEFSYSNNQWTIQDIATLSGQHLLAIGDPRSDGFGSLYITGGDGIHEISFRNAVWESTLVDSVQKDFNLNPVKFCVGNGRGDGKDAIYTSNFVSDIAEIRFENGSWKRSSLGQLISLPPNTVIFTSIAITKAHNGRSNLIVYGDKLYEFYFDNGQWKKVLMGEEPGINEICDGVGRNDAIHRVYCSENFDRVTEYTLVGDTWIKTSQRRTGASTALNALAAGPGRGDGVNRIYVLQFIGHLYEFTFNQ